MDRSAHGRWSKGSVSTSSILSGTSVSSVAVATFLLCISYIRRPAPSAAAPVIAAHWSCEDVIVTIFISSLKNQTRGIQVSFPCVVAGLGRFIMVAAPQIRTTVSIALPTSTFTYPAAGWRISGVIGTWLFTVCSILPLGKSCSLEIAAGNMLV